MIKSRAASIFGLVVVLSAGFVATTIPASAASSSECFSNEVVSIEEIDRISDEACGYEEVKIELLDGRKFPVPEPEYSVTQSPMTRAGVPAVEEVTVTRSPEGSVSVRIGEELEGTPEAQAYQLRLDGVSGVHAHEEDHTEAAASSSDAAVAAAAVDRCVYGAPWATNGKRWTPGTTFSWRYNSLNAPAGALTAISDAADTWSGDLNVCGSYFRSDMFQSRDVSATATRNGLNSDGECAVDNAKSDIFWAALEPYLDYLAVTCTRALGGVTLTSDQVYNTNYLWSTGLSCSGYRYDLRSVATHEFGHSFGLAHVSQESNQVMSPSTNYCETTQRNLARGDATGISALY